MDRTIEAVICGMDVTISTNNIHIQDSYLVWRRNDMKLILNSIQDFLKENNITMDTPFNHRSINSMVNEWVTHNNAYSLCFEESRTRSVDLNYPQKWYMPILYWLCSRIIL